MLVENMEIFLYTSAFENFTIMGICVVSFFVHAFPSGRVLYLEAHVNLTLE